MSRYVCIHGHFYQPPRENPWLDLVETQDSAYPYHDWNERVTAECYAPNAAAQLLDAEGRVRGAVQNYSAISFDVGPTLLAWLRAQAPQTYRDILEADRLSAARFGGHGSAMAQAYNHIIMPLATPRDQRTQVVWGLRDFEHHFGRRPEGMWLPETAVDTPTLELLAEHGVRFTVLAPHQAVRVRPPGGAWRETPAASMDTRRPYLLRLPSGRTIALFFYDGPLSRAIAFDRLLSSGDLLAYRLRDGSGPEDGSPHLAHVATDGETYGHHHRFGDMALARAIELLEADPAVTLTNYGQFLERFPPAWEVQVAEATSWSCAHGVERWRSDCGCNTGMHPTWQQGWRAPLRAALDWLRDDLATLFERSSAGLLPDPWAARDGYIDVVLQPTDEVRARFLARHAPGAHSAEAATRALTLLEMQRHALLMYTSCGWFFDDIAGLEATQVLLYAARAIELASAIDGADRTESFVRLLRPAVSNDPAAGTGADVYRAAVARAAVGWDRAAAHAALLAVLGRRQTDTPLLRFDTSGLAAARWGGDRLAVGRVRVSDHFTLRGAERAVAAVAPAGSPAHCWVGDGPVDLSGLAATFAVGGAEALDRHLQGMGELRAYGLEALLEDDRRALLAEEVEATLGRLGRAMRAHLPGLRPPRGPAASTGTPPPGALRTAAAAAVQAELRQLLAGQPTAAAVGDLLDAARAWDAPLDYPGLSHTLTLTLRRLAAALAEAPEDPARQAALLQAVLASTLPDVPLRPSLWHAQRVVLGLLKGQGGTPLAALAQALRLAL